MTTGIKTSCKHKRELYLTSRDSNNPRLKGHCKLFCKVLSNAILEAKRNVPLISFFGGTINCSQNSPFKYPKGIEQMAKLIIGLNHISWIGIKGWQ
jgi:hypothetical protein